MGRKRPRLSPGNENLPKSQGTEKSFEILRHLVQSFILTKKRPSGISQLYIQRILIVPKGDVLAPIPLGKNLFHQVKEASFGNPQLPRR
jgi:hypothetical protein